MSTETSSPTSSITPSSAPTPPPRAWWRTAITNLERHAIKVWQAGEVRILSPQTSILLTPDEWRLDRARLSQYAVLTRHLTLPASSSLSFLPPRPPHGADVTAE